MRLCSEEKKRSSKKENLFKSVKIRHEEILPSLFYESTKDRNQVLSLEFFEVGFIGGQAPNCNKNATTINDIPFEC